MNVICIMATPTDMAIAGRLAKSLRKYRLPKAYQPETWSVSVLCAQEDMVDWPLLTKAALLLLLCSPESKTDPVFIDSIHRHKQLGPDQRMIPILVRGEPSESMPEGFIEKRFVKHILPDMSIMERMETTEPVAADLRAANRHSLRKLIHYETVRIMASLLNLYPNELENREEQRGRRRAALLIGCILGICLVCSALFLQLAYLAKVEGDIAQLQMDKTLSIAERTFGELSSSFQGQEKAMVYVDEAAREAKEALQTLGLYQGDF